MLLGPMGYWFGVLFFFFALFSDCICQEKLHRSRIVAPLSADKPLIGAFVFQSYCSQLSGAKYHVAPKTEAVGARFLIYFSCKLYRNVPKKGNI